jgi:hypothetical protein
VKNGSEGAGGPRVNPERGEDLRVFGQKAPNVFVIYHNVKMRAPLEQVPEVGFVLYPKSTPYSPRF